MKSSKILVSLVIVLIVLVVGNVVALATEPTQITASVGATNKNTNTNNTNTNSNKNTNLSVVGASNTNRNTNKTNTSSYNSTSTNSSKLPYAGTGNASVVLIAIGFAASAVYAYKKVSDYNI